MEIEEKDRLLFMRYALPCAGTIIQRGNVPKEYVDELTEIVKSGKKIPKDAEKIFKVAFAACSLMALDKKKKSIDKEIIINYYLFGHDSVIDKRYEEMGDFDPVPCRIRSGVVQEVEDGFAIVSNTLGKKKYRTDFLPDIKINDLVTTHWSFIIEKIDQKTFDKMKNQKEKLKLK